MFSVTAKALLIATTAVLLSVPAHATSVKEFDAMKPADQTAFLANFFDNMTSDIGQKNPVLASKIKAFFFSNEDGKPFSQGMENIYVQLTAIDLRAKAGKADPSKLQMETIIVYVVKQAFPPDAPPGAAGS